MTYYKVVINRLSLLRNPCFIQFSIGSKKIKKIEDTISSHNEKKTLLHSNKSCKTNSNLQKAYIENTKKC